MESVRSLNVFSWRSPFQSMVVLAEYAKLRIDEEANG